MGSQYVGKVANPSEILLVSRKRVRDQPKPKAEAESREFRTDEKAAVVIQKMATH